MEAFEHLVEGSRGGTFVCLTRVYSKMHDHQAAIVGRLGSGERGSLFFVQIDESKGKVRFLLILSLLLLPFVCVFGSSCTARPGAVATATKGPVGAVGGGRGAG